VKDLAVPDVVKGMNETPEPVEHARRILKDAQRNTIARLVTFVNENEDEVLGSSREDFDATGTTERLTGLQQEIFVLCYLLGSLPQPAQPAPAPKPS
jgi:hypothetical protein